MSLVRNSLFPYLLVSVVFHLVLAFTWGNRPVRPPPMEEILVKLLPPPAVQEKPAPRAAAPRASAPAPRTAAPAPPPPKPIARETPREKPTRAELPPGQPAKIDRSGAEAPPPKKSPAANSIQNKSVDEAVEPKFETAKNEKSIAAAPSTKLQDLLPPVFQPSSQENARNTSEPIRLDSRDPKYSDYLRRVKQALDLAWADPSVARSAIKSYGIDGKLIIRFLPNERGEIEEIYLIRTSGYSVLDQEALRVVSAAAPFFGRPPRDGRRPIDVTFIYEKDAISYSFTPR